MRCTQIGPASWRIFSRPIWPEFSRNSAEKDFSRFLTAVLRQNGFAPANGRTAGGRPTGQRRRFGSWTKEGASLSTWESIWRRNGSYPSPHNLRCAASVGPTARPCRASSGADRMRAKWRPKPSRSVGFGNLDTVRGISLQVSQHAAGSRIWQEGITGNRDSRRTRYSG